MEQAKCELGFPGCKVTIEFDGQTEIPETPGECQECHLPGVLYLTRAGEWVGTVVQLGLMTVATKCAACDALYEPEGWNPLKELAK